MLTVDTGTLHPRAPITILGLISTVQYTRIELPRDGGNVRTLLLLVLLATSGIANAVVAGFDTLRWDMSRQEVQRLQPNFEEWDEEGTDLFSRKPVTNQMYGLKTYLIGGCKFALKLEFVENRLSRVVLNQHHTDETKCRPMLLADLALRYGDRPKYGNTPYGETFRWDTGSETIVLRVDQLSDQRESAAVIYTSKVAISRLLQPNKL